MTFDILKSMVSGSVTCADDPTYRRATDDLLWNRRKQSRHPKIIVRAKSVADVQATVRYAAQNGLTVSPRGGGHNFSGIAMQNGIVLDLGALDGFAIDADNRIAEVEPAVTNATLAGALEAAGLSFPLGHCGSVPMSGYLLGGGLGWNSGTWGIACTRVEALDVVMPDGALRRVSATEWPDIYWAARGAGPEFFGVVVKYRLKLESMPGAITSCVRVYPIERAGEVDRWMTDVLFAAPENVDVTLQMKNVPHPDFDRPVPVAIAICVVYGADADAAQRMHDAISELSPAEPLQVIGPMPSPISALYHQTAETMPSGKRYAIDSFWIEDRPEAVVAKLAEAVAAAPSALSHSLVTRFPPTRPALPDVAFSMMASTWASVCAIWDDGEADDTNIAWVRNAADAIGDAPLGHYVGESDLERPGRLERCYAHEALGKIRAMQQIHDPKGMFRPFAVVGDGSAGIGSELARVA